MNTKKCSKCGWEYSIEWPGSKCRFCGEPFTERPCSCCGTITTLQNGLCTPCKTKRHMEWKQARRFNANKAFDEWLAKVKNAKCISLTEEQWMQACTHFGGCAYCGSPEIDSRSMFITFKQGGRYCAWNIVPACEKCETAIKVIDNPFMRMDPGLFRNSYSSARKYGFTIDNLNKIVDYLQSKMEVDE